MTAHTRARCIFVAKLTPVIGVGIAVILATCVVRATAEKELAEAEVAQLRHLLQSSLDRTRKATEHRPLLRKEGASVVRHEVVAPVPELMVDAAGAAVGEPQHAANAGGAATVAATVLTEFIAIEHADLPVVLGVAIADTDCRILIEWRGQVDSYREGDACGAWSVVHVGSERAVLASPLPPFEFGWCRDSARTTSDIAQGSWRP